MSLGLVEREQAWKHYGYEIYDLVWDSYRLPYKLILRNGAPVSIVSSRYRLIPIEYAEEVASELALHLQASLVRREYSYVRLSHPTSPLSVPVRVWLIYDMPGKEHRVGNHTIRFSYTVVNSMDTKVAFQILLTNAIDNRVYAIVPTRWAMALSPAEVAAYIREVHVGKKPIDPIERMAERARQLIEEAEAMLPFLALWAEMPTDDELIDALKRKLPKIYLPPSVTEAGVKTYMTLFDVYVEIAEKIWTSQEIGIDRRFQLFRALHSVFRAQR